MIFATHSEGVAALARLPIYPVLLTAALVVNRLTDLSAPAAALGRPLVVAVALMAVVQLVLWVLFRDRHLAAVLATIALFLVIGIPAEAMVAVAGGLLAALLYGLRHRDIWQRASRLGNLVGGITVAFALAAAGPSLIPSWPSPTVAVARTSTEAPDIYVILLDGYPRSDTLVKEFGFDNRPFLDELAGLGFAESAQSRSNYVATTLTLASMFNRTHVRDLGLIESSGYVNLSAAYRAIDHGRVFDDLRTNGYEIVSLATPFAGLTVRSADRALDGGQMSDLELSLVQTGHLGKILPDVQEPLIVDQHRSRIKWAFDTLVDLAAERRDQPQFVFTHVLAPHMPVVFGPEGEDRVAWPPCVPSCGLYGFGLEYGRPAYDEAFVGQVAGINRIVATTVREIIARSAQPPVIVLVSDHGMRYDYSDHAELSRSLFVASTPGRRAVFPENVTPINLVPRLLNAYAGAELPFATEESYLSDMSLADHGILTVLDP